MKNINTILAVGTVAAVCGAAEAAVYYSTNFGSGYTNGNLAGTVADDPGQNFWKQTGSIATNPIQVSNGFAMIGPSGQDVYVPGTTSASATAGTSYYLSATLTFTAAQATGDYFMHVSLPAGTTSSFYGRVAAKSSGAGFLLGISTGTSTFSYGSTVLNFNQSYNVVMSLDFLAGASNDVASIFVDPNSSNRNDLTAYASSAAWGSVSEPTAIGAINLRQGAASNAPTLKVASLAAGDSLVAVGVPSPGALALLGVAGLVTSRRRK